MAIEVKLPDIGEGIEHGTVVGVLVSVGDQVEKDQPLVELETDKAVVDYAAEEEGWIGRLLVAGGTSTGKTTLTNALLAEVAKTADRVVIIEDTRELQCAAPNLVAMRTKDGVATLSDLVRSSLRLRPDRIPIGEVRGSEALDLLKAWGTGHPGGIGTIHAGTGIGALRRLEQLIQEAVVTVPRALIAETIDLVAVLSGRGSARRLAELARVEGLGPDGDYRITPAIQISTGESS